MVKKWVVGLALMLALIVVGCSASVAPIDEQPPAKMSPAAPALKVFTSDAEVETMLGTYSWFQKTATGGISAEADAEHPLACKDYMPSLALPSKLTVTLQFDIDPNEIHVRCWSTEDWGQTEAKGESIAVVDNGGGRAAFDLKNSPYIYEVVAVWNSTEAYEGTAHYSFYTIK